MLGRGLCRPPVWARPDGGCRSAGTAATASRSLASASGAGVGRLQTPRAAAPPIRPLRRRSSPIRRTPEPGWRSGCGARGDLRSGGGRIAAPAELRSRCGRARRRPAGRGQGAGGDRAARGRSLLVRWERRPERSTDSDLHALAQDEPVEPDGVRNRVSAQRCLANICELQVGVHGGLSTLVVEARKLRSARHRDVLRHGRCRCPARDGSDRRVADDRGDRRAMPPVPGTGRRPRGALGVGSGGHPVRRLHRAPGRRVFVGDIFAAVPHASRCYTFSFISETQSARDAHVGDADRIITSLRFTT